MNFNLPSDARVAELRTAFELVQNKENWKLPIDAFVPADADVATIREAVIHFAGCVPHFDKRGLKGLAIRVTAVGYYEAVGA